GYHAYFAQEFRRNSDTQLNNWSEDPRLTPPHYGASNLFFLYLMQHYGGYQNLKLLLNGPEDGIEAVNAYLTRLGYDKTFKDVYKDWAIANAVNASDGPYGYTERKVPILDTKLMIGEGSRRGELGQFGSHYINLRFAEGDVLVSFEGNETVPLIPVQAHSGDYCWWSNRGDSIDSTLTRQFDLSRLDKATLEFWAWYELEERWDYIYIEVSADGGLTWDILKGMHTSEANPVGNSFGHGLTGKSNGWIQERFDLTPYAGDKVLLRFQYVTDDAVNLRGLCLDDLSIPELGYFDDAEEDRGWKAEGFVRTNNRLPQDFFVQVIEQGKNTRVREMELDQNRKGEVLIEGFGSQVKDAILVISPVTPGTTEPAHYTLTVKRVGEK
ncbi:MAG: immune inhibitor A, partial [Chloroflexi bacterium]|nr:immune inhibitor A [Chloroflexota bacterium]